MPDFKFLDKADVHNSFQVAWESTLKCNLDCSYCSDGHDNTVDHPTLEDSLKTVDFIIEYLNLYMQTRPDDQKRATINIQGGESIFHPHIMEILKYIRSKKGLYADWHLDVALITNGITGADRWKKISSLVDWFTMSYHSESMPKQQEMFRTNVLHLKSKGDNFKVAILMHPKHWDNCMEMVEWCKANNIPHNARQLDHSWLDFRFNYSEDQNEFLTGAKKIPVTTKVISFFKNGIDLSSHGRACCANQVMCTDKSAETTYIKGNNFKGWHCSVNRFFLFIRQSTGEIFSNKDCKMNLDSKVGVLGYLEDSDTVLADLKEKIETNTLPTIICKKSSCWCGLCAPKAADLDTYNMIMEKYLNANTSN